MPRSKMSKFLFAIVGSIHDCDDILQEAWIRTSGKILDEDGGMGLSHQYLRNYARNWRRQNIVRERHVRVGVDADSLGCANPRGAFRSYLGDLSDDAEVQKSLLDLIRRRRLYGQACRKLGRAKLLPSDMAQLASRLLDSV